MRKYVLVPVNGNSGRCDLTGSLRFLILIDGKDLALSFLNIGNA